MSEEEKGRKKIKGERWEEKRKRGKYKEKRGRKGENIINYYKWKNI